MKKNRSDERLLSRNELAKIINVKPETITKWASTKRYDLKPNRMKKTPRYRFSIVSAVLQADLRKAGARCSS